LDVPISGIQLSDRGASPRSCRRRAKMNAAQPKHAAFAENHLITEAAGALRLHLVASNQELSNPVIDVIIDCPVGNQACAPSEAGVCIQRAGTTPWAGCPHAVGLLPPFPPCTGHTSSSVSPAAGGACHWSFAL
jgi:hypothetical protein